MKKLFTAILFFLVINISYPQGQLDNTFGIDGKVTTNITPCYDEYPGGASVQQDGKIVVAGYAYNGPSSNANFNIVRYNSDGTLDKTFGANGKVTTDFNNSQDIATSIDMQDDGKIVVMGYISGSGNSLAIARYNTDGTLDDSFGGTGKIITDFGEYASSVIVQDNGKIVAAGSGSNGTISGMALVRYNSDGSLDPTFDSDGRALYDGLDPAASLAVQSDGKILSTTSYNNGTNNDFVVVRFNSDGTMDGTFGTGGISALADFGNSDFPQSITIQPDEKIVVAGYVHNGTNYDFALARYNKDGTLDLAFGSNGKAQIDFNNLHDFPADVFVQSDNKIVIAGYTGDFGSQDFALTRYNSNGTLDDSFGTDGVETVGLSNARACAAIQTGEKIIVAGSIESPASFNDFGAVRLNGDGSLDGSFGVDGITTTDLGNSSDVAYSTALQTDGKLIAAGYTFTTDHTNLAIARYNVDGILDTTFGTYGRVIRDDGTSIQGRSVTIVDGKIFVAGNYSNGSDNDFFLIKYNSDGSLDNTFSGGSVTTNLSGSNDYARSLAVQANKKMVVAGYISSGIGGGDFAVVRYNVNGSLDMSFSSDGIVTTDIAASNDIGLSAAVQLDDQKIVVTGYANNGTDNDFAVVRYNEDGNLDNNFGTNGKVTSDIQSSDDVAQSILFQPDKKIIVAGYSHIDTVYSIAIARYESNGQLDNSFGENGKVITTIDGFNAIGSSVVIQSDGKIIVAGYIFDNSGSDVVMVRYNTDGILDQTFGNNGIETIDFAGSYDVGFSAVIQPDGKLIAAGYSFDNYSNDFALLRYNAFYPSIQLSNKTINFGDVKIDSSAVQNVFVKNTGSASLNIDSITSSNAAFTLAPQSFTIFAGDSQEVTITFTPTSGSNYNSLISIYNNSAVNPDTINVQGKGIAENSQISLSVSAIDFGTITVNDSLSQNFFVRNTGPADLQVTDIVSDKSNFRVNIKSFTVAPDDSQQVVVTFQPTDTIQYDGTLGITHSAQGSPSEISLSGEGTSELIAIIDLSASNLHFGSITVNSNIQKNLIINNLGTDSLHVANISSNQNVFAIDKTNFTVAPKESQEVLITFTPTDSISYNAVLTITHDAAGSPNEVSLTGKGTSGLIAIINLSASNLNFGSVTVNNNIQKSLTINNIGTDSLHITNINSNQSVFTVNKTNFTVAPKGSQEVLITFTPADSISYNAFLTITHDAAGNPGTVNLSGRGISGTIAIINLPVNSLNFGTIMINNNVQKSITVKNIGTAPLSVDNIISNNSAFTVTQPSSFIVASNDSHQVEITFTPASAQEFTALLDIFHNAAGSPSKINLAGIGFSYPSSLSVNVTKTFSNVSNINNYRIVGVPGQIDLLISSLESGDYEFDWSVFDDNGQDENYLIAGSDFKFSPGKAFWIISKNPVTINQQINSVAINGTDYSFSIPLHSGWNLISSPFNKQISWDDVKALNGLAQNSILYAWNGSWSNPAVLSPFEGYYFNNTGNLSSLKIPFITNSSAAGKLSKIQYNGVDFSKLLKLTLSEKNQEEESDIFVGINPSSKEDFDESDYYAAPGDFQQTGIRIILNDLPPREKYFFIEQRPQIDKGQSFDLEIKSIPNRSLILKCEGIKNFDKYNIYLLDERLKNLYNLKELNNIELTLAHKFNNFKLIIGTDEYLNEIKKKFLPNDFTLHQNYPNPFNPKTVIRFALKEKENITLKIYNILGEVVRTLIYNKFYTAGNYEVQFFAADLASGVYIARLESQKFTSQIKMILLK